MEFFKPEEVAKILKIDLRTIYRLIKKGEIPVKKVGMQYRIPESFLKEYTGKTVNKINEI